MKSLQFPAKKLGFETEDDALSWTNPDRFQTATLAFIWLGVLLRVVTFALNFPLWGDEAFVAVNLISRGYRDLLRPLDYAQICPLFFLWLELTAVKLLGFSEWSLRLIPTMASVGGVFLFAHIVGRVTSRASPNAGGRDLLGVVLSNPARRRGQAILDGFASFLDPDSARASSGGSARTKDAGSGHSRRLFQSRWGCPTRPCSSLAPSPLRCQQSLGSCADRHDNPLRVVQPYDGGDFPRPVRCLHERARGRLSIDLSIRTTGPRRSRRSPSR